MSSADDTRWVKIANNLAQNPKVAELPDDVYLSSIGLMVLAICYCDQNMTDGYITDRALRKLSHRDSQVEIEALVEAKGPRDKDGILRPHEAGYQVVGYLDWQRSRAEKEAKSRQASGAAKSRWGQVRDANSNATRNAERIANSNAERNAEESRVEESRVESAPRAKANPYFGDVYQVYESVIGGIATERDRSTMRTWADVKFPLERIRESLTAAKDSGAEYPVSWANKRLIEGGGKPKQTRELTEFTDGVQWGCPASRTRKEMES